MNGRCVVVLLGLIGLSLPTVHPAMAQEADAVAAERPFIDGGRGDRPYLLDLAGRLAIGGYAEGHFRFERQDGITEDLGFEAKRFNLFFHSQVSDFVRFGTELEVEEGGEELKLEYMTVDLAVHRALNLRGGMILVPLGRFNLSHDSPLNPFTDRPLVATDIEAVALSEPGFGAFGLFPLSGTGQLTYELYAVNGFDSGVLEDNPDGTRIPDGRGNFEDNNNSLSIVGRLAWSPLEGTGIGVSAHTGAYNVSSIDGLQVDDRRDITVWALDAELGIGELDLTGEAAFASIDVPETVGPLFANSQRGAFVDAVLPFWRGRIATMPTSFFSVKARLDYVDLDTDLPGDDRIRVSVGLNFQPTNDTVFKLDGFRGRTHDRFNNPADQFGVLFSAATYF